ncbi:hypothetical protein CIPAW_01G221500 [Carya illinoinensis]|uniref:Uncharacterized protein n=1 Tax=Carya illinoinensis TaxID=32201 RepID=A0A8T1RQX0_CARIL|nr:hypothetical protein CIPAW_01G221500 [Carya illinoinensis]
MPSLDFYILPLAGSELPLIWRIIRRRVQHVVPILLNLQRLKSAKT